MERAARLIAKNKATQPYLDESEVARGIWRTAVGSAIARHTVSVRVVRDKLVVEVEDATWQRQLHGLSQQILARVQKCLGSSSLHSIEFRVAVPRRQPQTEDRARPNEATGVDDEAERILDPMLKKVFQLSRKRSIA